MDPSAAIGRAWPAEGHICLWSAPRERGAREHMIADGAALLSTSEHAQLHAFASQARREIFVLGRTLMKTVLAGYLGADAGSIDVTLGANGKPAVEAAAAAGLAFNLSHSGTEVILAVARADGLGVDVERADRAGTALRIAGRFFNREERERLGGAEGGDGAGSDALLLWTLKESIGKAMGRTVWDGLSEHCLAIEAGNIVRLAPLPDGGKTRTWRLSVGRWGRGHILALTLFWDEPCAPTLSYCVAGAGLTDAFRLVARDP